MNTNLSLEGSGTPEPSGYPTENPGGWSGLVEPLKGRSLPWSKTVWREYGYLSLQFLLCPFAFAYAIFVPSFASGMLVTVVGLFAVGGLVLGARGWGAMYRGFDRGLLGSRVVDPPPFVRPRGFWRSLVAMVFDGAGWRALLYMLVSFPLALVAWIFSTTWLAVGLGGLTYWFWYRFLPLQIMTDGTAHRGWSFVLADWYWFADTPWRIFLVALLGVAFWAMWAPMTRGFARLFRALGAALLGPTLGSQRVAELRRSRAGVVEDADTRLRQIERDLHDGTQARLVSIAMQLGEAKEELVAENLAPAQRLVDAAHQSTKDALVELREIIVGIHPGVLEAGLGVAIRALAARSAVPIGLELGEVDTPPIAPAISSITYYSIAELLTNITKHSGATRAILTITRHPDALGVDSLWIQVSDNGHGGAVVGGPDGLGTGLAGVAERIASVDGIFRLTSPRSGPTLIDIQLPTHT